MLNCVEPIQTERKCAMGVNDRRSLKESLKLRRASEKERSMSGVSDILDQDAFPLIAEILLDKSTVQGKERSGSISISVYQGTLRVRLCLPSQKEVCFRTFGQLGDLLQRLEESLIDSEGDWRVDTYAATNGNGR